jgi:hypothetical protein
MGDTMKHIRNTVCAVFLATVLVFSAIAGEIQHPGADPTPTPTPTPTESSIAGEIQHPGFAAFLIDLIESALSLL